MKKVLAISFIIWFLILNIFSIKDFYYNALGNYFFSKADFKNALGNYSNSNNKESILNTANTYYKQKKYIVSLKKYLSILSDNKTEFSFRLNHNIWNNYYKLSLNAKQNEIKYLENAVHYYTSALNIRYDEQTKQNLDFVLNKLKKTKEENQQTQTWETNQSGTKTQSWELSNSWSLQKSSSWSQNSNSWSVSKDIKEQLKAYEEQLKQDQKQNQNQVWKVSQNSSDPFSQFDSFFGNDPFFDNSDLGWNNNKKDW